MPWGEQCGVLRQQAGDALGEGVIKTSQALVHDGVVDPVAAEDQAEVTVGIGDEGKVGTDHGCEASTSASVGIHRGQRLVNPRDQPGGGTIQESDVEIELAGEVLVEHRLGYARMIGNVVHARCVVAAGDEDDLGRGQQFGPALVPGLARVAGHPRHDRMVGQAYPRQMATDLLPTPVDVRDTWLPHALIATRHLPSTATDAPPAVYLHGLGGSSLNWTDLMFRLVDRVDGWAVDLPGFGASPPPRDGDLSPRGHAQVAASFIEHEVGQPVHLFGNSLGGAIAVQLAARRPDLVRTLTLISPALPDLRPRRASAHLPVIAVPGLGERLVERYVQSDPRARVQATIDACVAKPERISPQRIQEAIDEVAQRDHLTYADDAVLRSLRGLLRSYLDRSGERPWKLAERVTAPTLAIYGQRDGLVDARSADRITKHFRESRVVILADCGHVAQMEHPDWVVRAWEAAFPTV